MTESRIELRSVDGYYRHANWLSHRENVMPKQVAFKIGDIVKLKSGGPNMAVERNVGSEGLRVECQWFAGKKLESGIFPGDSLEPVEAEK